MKTIKRSKNFYRFKKITWVLSTIVGVLALQQTSQALEATADMGKGLYEQTGANSCLYCHGIDGKGGKVAAAAEAYCALI